MKTSPADRVHRACALLLLWGAGSLVACGSPHGSTTVITTTDANTPDATAPRDAVAPDVPAALDDVPGETVPVNDVQVNDAAVNDTAPDDAPSGRGALFGNCTGAVTCEDLPNAVCLSDFVGGMCSRTCTTDAECGPSGVCAGGQYCFLRCHPGANDCGAVHGTCFQFPAGYYACNPSCGVPPPAGAPDCVAGYHCDPWNNACVARSSAGADNGAPCHAAADCRGNACYAEVDTGHPTGYLDGYCLSVGRRPADGAFGPRLPRGTCPPGSVAYAAAGLREGDPALCLPECTTDADCRAGYRYRRRLIGDAHTYVNGICNIVLCGGAGGEACPTGTTCQATVRHDGSATQVCARCTPMCTGRACGADGCGGSCGACPTGMACTAGGQCACVAACAGRVCGTDGCGGSCGTCPTGMACNASGRCACTPNCAGRTCGTDGCGGSCGGPCAAGMMCGASGTCVACVPVCAGRTCGSNGCGGSCGTCPTGMDCTAAGACRVTPCDPVGETGCPAGQRCALGGTGATTCIADTGTTAVGFPCSRASDCTRGGFCAAIGFDTLCRRLCRTDGDCPGGRCAISVAGTTEFRVCTSTCDPVTGGTCAGGDSCFVFDTTVAREVTDCQPTGSGSTGIACSRPDGCSNNYSCVAGTCQRVCATGTSCLRGACRTVSGWSRYGVCP